MADKGIKKEWEFDLKEFKDQYKENDYYSLKEKALMKLKILIRCKSEQEQRKIIYNMKMYYQSHVRETGRMQEVMYSVLNPIMIFILTAYMTFTFANTDKYKVPIGAAFLVVCIATGIIMIPFIRGHFTNYNKKAYYQFYYDIIEQFEIELEKSFVSDSKTDKNSNKRKKNKKRKKST